MCCLESMSVVSFVSHCLRLGSICIFLATHSCAHCEDSVLISPPLPLNWEVDASAVNGSQKCKPKKGAKHHFQKLQSMQQYPWVDSTRSRSLELYIAQRTSSSFLFVNPKVPGCTMASTFLIRKTIEELRAKEFW